MKDWMGLSQVICIRLEPGPTLGIAGPKRFSVKPAVEVVFTCTAGNNWSNKLMVGPD